MVRSTLGQDPEVITGDEEAELSFAGAVGELDPATGPFLVVDIGGGSTELVVGIRDRGDEPDQRCGQPGHRLRADHRTDPAVRPADRRRTGRGHRAGSRSMLIDGLDRLPIATVRRLVPVSGTATTVAAAALKLPSLRPGPDPPVPDPGRPGAQGRRHSCWAPTGRTGRHSATCIPGRVDVIGGGALILSTMVALVAAAGADQRGHRLRTRHPGRHRAVARARRLTGRSRAAGRCPVATRGHPGCRRCARSPTLTVPSCGAERRPRSPIGRGRPLKMVPVRVRVPPGAPRRRSAWCRALGARLLAALVPIRCDDRSAEWMSTRTTDDPRDDQFGQLAANPGIELAKSGRYQPRFVSASPTVRTVMPDATSASICAARFVGVTTPGSGVPPSMTW